MTNRVRCVICPKGCELASGETGDCRVRINFEGEIGCITYSKPSAINIDPVEKKPLYHFLPGSPILSIGTSGCNLHCKPCQNWQLSQSGPLASYKLIPNEAVDLAVKRNCPSIAYTYAEPLVSFEYTLDCCKAATKAGLKNVLVTAAFINPKPLREIIPFVDAANVDIKSFSDDFYRDVCGAELKPVLTALKFLKEGGVMLEITNLLIPTLNDSVEETKLLCNWIAENLGPETPLHFSRFFPQNQLCHLPPTPTETLLRARDLALSLGLKFVYVGNMRDRAGENTTCPNCSKLLIERSGYQILSNRISDGKCPDCGTGIYGVWK